MLDRDKFEELQVRADGGDITDVLDIEQDVKPLAEKCITLGCKVLLLKCGAKGMYLQTAGEEKLRQVSVRTELDVAAWAEKAVLKRAIYQKKFFPEQSRGYQYCSISYCNAGRKHSGNVSASGSSDRSQLCCRLRRFIRSEII